MDKNSEILLITEIKLKLSDKKEITLTSEEARKVYEELGKLFFLDKALPAPKEKEYIPYPVYPTYPIYIERNYPGYDYWKITCKDDGNSTPLLDLGYNTCLSINLVNDTK
jgi:hypothetical protein